MLRRLGAIAAFDPTFGVDNGDEIDPIRPAGQFPELSSEVLLMFSTTLELSSSSPLVASSSSRLPLEGDEWKVSMFGPLTSPVCWEDEDEEEDDEDFVDDDEDLDLDEDDEDFFEDDDDLDEDDEEILDDE